MHPPKKLLADKAYYCAAFRDWLSRRGTTSVIPNKINRRKPFHHNKRAYRHRNKIERMFCRLNQRVRSRGCYFTTPTDTALGNLGADCVAESLAGTLARFPSLKATIIRLAREAPTAP